MIATTMNAATSERTRSSVFDLGFAAVSGGGPTIEGSCDFLGVNGWKREWQNRIIGHGGRGVRG
jgi:hypothetical protein